MKAWEWAEADWRDVAREHPEDLRPMTYPAASLSGVVLTLDVELRRRADGFFDLVTLPVEHMQDHEVIETSRVSARTVYDLVRHGYIAATARQVCGRPATYRSIQHTGA